MSDQIKAIVEAFADVCNLVDGLFHGAGFLSLFKLFPLLSVLKGTDFVALRAAFLVDESRLAMESAFKAKLVLSNAAVELKLESGIDLVEEGVKLAEKEYGDGVEVFAFFEKMKAFVGA